MYLLLGCGMIVLCVAIQCFVVSFLIRYLYRLDQKKLIRTTLSHTWMILIAVLMVLLAGNLLQVAVWAAIFLSSGEFVDFQTAFYHSLVNFTTLGYGDLVMSAERRILGALEATNGVLMLGLTTSVLYWAISTSFQRKKNKYMAE